MTKVLFKIAIKSKRYLRINLIKDIQDVREKEKRKTFLIIYKRIVIMIVNGKIQNCKIVYLVKLA